MLPDGADEAIRRWLFRSAYFHAIGLLRLTATYAHSWNTPTSHPNVIAERLIAIRTVCAAVWRDPVTLEMTDDVKMFCPDLMDHSNDVENHVVGTTDELVAILQAYEVLGLAEVTCRLS